MALIVITVQDTETGAVVSLASEPSMNMAAPPAGDAQKLAHLMLGALPMNAPQEAAASAATQAGEVPRSGLSQIAEPSHRKHGSFLNQPAARLAGKSPSLLNALARTDLNGGAVHKPLEAGNTTSGKLGNWRHEFEDQR